MQGNFTNSSMISPLSNLRLLEYGGGSGSGGGGGVGHDGRVSSPSMVTPCGGGGTSLEQLFMARRMRQRENYTTMNASSQQFISPDNRADISRAVYGILRDNLPQSLEYTTPPEDILAIANSIETKLYQTAPSPRAYSALATLEFRITALATAVLIHSDSSSGEGGGVSETCARLSAAAKKSLVYCVMVLISYEKRNLDKYHQSNKRQQHQQFEGGSSRSSGRGATHTQHSSLSSYSERNDQYFQSVDKTTRANNTSHNDKSKSSPNNGGTDKNRAGIQIALEDSQRVRPFPPSA